MEQELKAVTGTYFIMKRVIFCFPITVKRAMLCFTVIGAFFVNSCFAQKPGKANKKILKQAEIAFERADFLKAYNLYAKSLKVDSLNYRAIYKSGLCLFNIDKTDTGALKYFIRSNEKIPEAHFYAARIFHLRGESKNALSEFYYFRSINKEETITNSEVEDWIAKCETAIKKESEKENYVVRNIGEKINSRYPEYVPLIWNLDGSLLFTSRREGSTGGLFDPYGKYYEDIYTAHKKDSAWSEPVQLGDNLNTATHDACVAFSPRGDELIIYRTDARQTGGDLYSTKYNGANWSVPVIMGPAINSDYLEASACFSPGGNKIIFSSNRPGGYGGKDLYKVQRFLNGAYSLPSNLGPTINTVEDEDAPFIDKNDNTLYFSSRGHNSMGEYDIFKAVFNPDQETWINVENMGQPINSTNDDIYFIKQDNKNVAYFTSRREGGYGDADIYEVNFSESSKVIVYCKVNTNNIPHKQLQDLQISLYDLKTGNLEGQYNPNLTYGNSILLVTKNKMYEMKVEGEDITPIVQQVTFNEKDKEIIISLLKKQE